MLAKALAARCAHCGSFHTETLSADGSGYRMIPVVNTAAASVLSFGAIPGMHRLIAAGLVLHVLVSKWLGGFRRPGNLYLVCRDCGHYAKL